MWRSITRNIDVAGGVVNGTIGTVENIQPNLITVRRLKDNELMCITRIKHYVSLRHSTDIAIREQFPLILGWAITVHRVQGMTISSNVFVVLDSTFFASGQAYVGQSLFSGLDHWTGLLDWNTGFTFDPKNSVQKASFSPL